MQSDFEISVSRQLRVLRAYAIMATAVSALALLGATSAWQNANVITVHRLNVVDQDGLVRLALYNKKHEPGPVIAGKEVSKADRSGGIRAGMFSLTTWATNKAAWHTTATSVTEIQRY